MNIGSLLRNLHAFGQRNLMEQLGNRAFQTKKVTRLKLKEDGTFLEYSDDRVELSIPRSSGGSNNAPPRLACGNLKYLFGGKKESEKNKHDAFVQEISSYVSKTECKAGKALAKFYSLPKEVDRAYEACRDVQSTIVIQVGLNVVVSLPQARDYWRARYEEICSETRIAGEGTCQVTGKYGPILRTHDLVNAKGMPSQAPGNSVNLMSTNQEAFCSYGWEQGENFPVSPEGGTYAAVLEYFLTLGEHPYRTRRDIGDTVFCFWTDVGTDFNVLGVVTNPEAGLVYYTAQRVDQVLSAPYGKGDEQRVVSAVKDEDNVHLLALSNHSKRLIVRSYDTASLRDVKRNLKGYSIALSMGSQYAPSLFRIVSSLHPGLEPKNWMSKAKGHIVKLAEKFLRRAIIGIPLGEDVMNKAVRMFVRTVFLRKGDAKETRKARQAAKRVLCGIIHLSYNESRKDGKMNELKPYLDEENRDKMYLAGRLQAFYEDLQSFVYGKNLPKRTFHDRFFQSMVNNPGGTLPRLAEQASRYLYSKARSKNEGVTKSKRRSIQEMHAEVALKPGPTSSKDKALFISGYFHQMKAFMERAAKASAAKSGSAQDNEPASSDEE